MGEEKEEKKKNAVNGEKPQPLENRQEKKQHAEYTIDKEKKHL